MTNKQENILKKYIKRVSIRKNKLTRKMRKGQMMNKHRIPNNND
jgi:hypothetical protein